MTVVPTETCQGIAEKNFLEFKKFFESYFLVSPFAIPLYQTTRSFIVTKIRDSSSLESLMSLKAEWNEKYNLNLKEDKEIYSLFAQHLEKKEYEPQRNEVDSYLNESPPQRQSLGCGFHKGVYYVGSVVHKDGIAYPCVVTSDKKIYIKKPKNDEIANSFGLCYRQEFYHECLGYTLTNETIKQWIHGNVDSITMLSVYIKIIKLLKRYIFFEDERNYHLLACYRIAGFFMPVWNARGRLFLWAEMGSAKSRLTMILHNTGFNSIALGDWTLAYLKSVIESTSGETHIDDFETLDEEKQNASMRLVKIGYMKGWKAGKMSDGNKRRPEVYDLFNTTTINNTQGLDFITSDRCEIVRIPKISKKEYDKEPNFQDVIWEEIRNELYILSLKYPSQVKMVYDSLKSERIKGRPYFVRKPELTIAKIVSDELERFSANLENPEDSKLIPENLMLELENFFLDELEQQQDIDYESDWEYLTYKRIYELSTNTTNSTLSTNTTLSTNFFNLLDDVVKPIGENLYGLNFESKKRSMSITIGRYLSRNPIFKKREVVGKKQYKVDLQKLKDYLSTRGFLKQIVASVDSVDNKQSKTYKDSIQRNEEEFVA